MTKNLFPPLSTPFAGQYAVLENRSEHRVTTRRIPVAVAVGLAVLLAVSGCSLLPSIPDIVNQGSSSNDNGGDSGSGDDSDIDENPFLDHEVPETFPDDVPLPDLDVVFSLDLGTGWSVVFHADELASDYADVTALYGDAGWETLADTSEGDAVLGIFENDGYQVQVSGTTDSNDYDGPVLAFTVVAKG